MKERFRLVSLFLLCIIVLSPPLVRAAENGPKYLDSNCPIELRIEDLLSRMTLEEKVGQMNIPCCYKQRIGWGIDVGEVSLHRVMTDEERERQIEGARKMSAGTWAEGIGPCGGFFTFSDRLVYEGTERQATLLNELQKVAVTESRLKIPLLQVEEGTHGLMCSGATIFPEGLGLGSSWDLDLIHDVYRCAALEGSSIGVHALCTLVVEPVRDPRLGRNEEAYSECPWFCSRIAETIVDALQGCDISAPGHLAAALCHYPGQSEPVGGLERGAMHLSERKLREIFLPSFAAGIKGSGAQLVMATYPAINSVAVHNSSWILKEILRKELGFDGVVLSEGRGISTIIDEHIVATQKAAGQLAAVSGVDVGISLEDAYLLPLIESVREGAVPMAAIDDAVRNILRLKFRLGLFENPYIDVAKAVETVHSEAHRELARRTSQEGIVLLKNKNGTLPLAKNLKRIAVIGPNADVDIDQLGDYSPYKISMEITSVLEGVKAKLGAGTKIDYVKGCDVVASDLDEIRKAARAAKRSDAAIVVVGETIKTDGEGRDVANLDLSGRQRELVLAVAGTGTPTIVVLINGRALSVNTCAEHADAIVEAWNCGERGGDAVADVIFGDCDPGGRLPVTFPRHSGQLPMYYNSSPTRGSRNYVDMPDTPLYAFGHGLSYTTFEYSGLHLSQNSILPGASVEVSVNVKNTGKRVGSEVVQLYINDVLSTVTTGVKELRGFRKIRLAPGEAQTVTFSLTPKELSLLDRHLQRVVEPGDFEIMVGHASDDIRQTATLTVLSPKGE